MKTLYESILDIDDKTIDKVSDKVKEAFYRSLFVRNESEQISINIPGKKIDGAYMDQSVHKNAKIYIEYDSERGSIGVQIYNRYMLDQLAPLEDISDMNFINCDLQISTEVLNNRKVKLSDFANISGDALYLHNNDYSYYRRHIKYDDISNFINCRTKFKKLMLDDIILNDFIKIIQHNCIKDFEIIKYSPLPEASNREATLFDTTNVQAKCILIDNDVYRMIGGFDGRIVKFRKELSDFILKRVIYSEEYVRETAAGIKKFLDNNRNTKLIFMNGDKSFECVYDSRYGIKIKPIQKHL